jgi:hypothetical protein
MQCSMHNQSSGLFTGIMNYLHVLCMLFMVLSYVLYMTLMLFIYVYYGLFACTNLVDIMSLFFMVFLFHLPIFNKNRSVSDTNRLEIARRFSEKLVDISAKPTDLLVKPADLSVFPVSLFLHRLRCISTEFSRFLSIFSKTDGIDDVQFSWFRRILEHWSRSVLLCAQFILTAAGYHFCDFLFVAHVLVLVPRPRCAGFSCRCFSTQICSNHSLVQLPLKLVFLFLILVLIHAQTLA